MPCHHHDGRSLRNQESIYEDLSGVKTLIISALRHESTHIHFGVDEAIAFGNRISAERVWLTHIAHEMDHQTENAVLPENVRLSYDGLEISLLSAFQKVPYQCLVIRDEDSFKVLLCSAEDAKSFETLLQDTDQSLPEGRSMFLIRPPLKPILGRSGPQVVSGNQSLPPEVSSHPKLRREMVQILFLMRHFFLDLNEEEWIQELTKWMDSVPDRAPYRDFYEKHVLRTRSIPFTSQAGSTKFLSRSIAFFAGKLSLGLDDFSQENKRDNHAHRIKIDVIATLKKLFHR